MTTPQSIRTALADARPVSYWLDRPERPKALPALEADTTTDLAIVGGGFTGLWTAVRAKEEDPDLDVVLIEADAISEGASGRNMGALWDDIAGGAHHALKEFPHEFQRLVELGRENTDGLIASLERYDIDAAFDPGDILYVARNRELAEQMRRHYEALGGSDEHAEFIDEQALRAEFHSPIFFGGTRLHAGRGVLDPARLAWGLRDAAVGLGVRIHEGTPMEGLSESGAHVAIRCPRAKLMARRVVLATNGYKSAVGRLRRRIAPMWQWSLMTEPLSPAQMESVGWSGRQGMGASDSEGGSADYHWCRLSIDNRIQIGGSTTYY